VCHRSSLRVLTESHLLLPQTQNSADWGIIRLDRSVPSSVATPVNVGTGQVPVGTPLMMIGHPVGLPRKYVAPSPFVISDAFLLCSILFHSVILASLTVYVASPPFVGPYFGQCLCFSSLHLIFARTFPFASNNTHDAHALFTLYH
jgi:hypothetical protein